MPEKPAYKRLETDAELIARAQTKNPSFRAWGARGETLDAVVEEITGLQRRIVEVYP